MGSSLTNLQAWGKLIFFGRLPKVNRGFSVAQVNLSGGCNGAIYAVATPLPDELRTTSCDRTRCVRA